MKFFCVQKVQKKCLSHIYLIFLYGYTCRRNTLYSLKCAPSATVFNALKIILIRYHKHFLMQKIESPPHIRTCFGIRIFTLKLYWFSVLKAVMKVKFFDEKIINFSIKKLSQIEKMLKIAFVKIQNSRYKLSKIK